MPRSPQEVVGFRGPFQGLSANAATRIPPNACADCLNVETRAGDIRRRPGLVAWCGPNGLAQLQYALRILPFWYNTGGGGETARQPYVAVGALYTEGGLQHFGVYIWWLGTAVYEMAPVVLAADETENGFGQYRFGLAMLGRALLIRSRQEQYPTVYYKEDSGPPWVARPLWLAQPQWISLLERAGGQFHSGDTLYYTATYVNRLTGSESPPDLATYPARTGITLTTGSSVRVTVRNPTDPGVTDVHIWRKIGGVDSEFYLLASVPQQGSQNAIYDDYGDVWIDKSRANTLDVSASYRPVRGADAVVHQGRLWLDEATYGTLCYSEYLQPGAFRVEHSLAVGQANDGDEVRRLVSTSEALFILKHHSIWMVTGSGPESYQARPLAEGIGLASDHAVANWGGRVWFAGWDGLYELTPQNLRKLSEPVAELWQRYRTLHWRTLGYDPRRDLLVVQGWTGAADDEPLCLVCHVGSGQWWKWDLGHFGAATVQLSFTDPPRLLLQIPADPGGSNPYTQGGWALLADDDDQEQRDYGQWRVAWNYDLGHSDGGTSFLKRVTHMGLEYVRDPAADVDEEVELVASLDQVPVVAGKALFRDGAARWPVGGVGMTFGMVVSGNNQHRPRITDLTLAAEVVGQR